MSHYDKDNNDEIYPDRLSESSCNSDSESQGTEKSDYDEMCGSIFRWIITIKALITRKRFYEKNTNLRNY